MIHPQGICPLIALGKAIPKSTHRLRTCGNNFNASLSYSFTGFGKTGDEAPKADILQQARLPVVTNSICSILNRYPTVTSTMLCAGYGLDFSHTESGCRGDSGGPFVCEKNGLWHIQGVVSWGSSRCISGENYTVFARVLKFVEWIKATIG